MRTTAQVDKRPRIGTVFRALTVSSHGLVGVVGRLAVVVALTVSRGGGVIRGCRLTVTDRSRASTSGYRPQALRVGMARG